MDGTSRFVGIDVAKTQVQIAVIPDGATWPVANDATGWMAVVAQLQELAPELIVLEASGRYEVGLVLALDAAGMTPVVLNPLLARRYAQSEGTRAKTDRVDAAMLARYGQRYRPTPQPVPGQTAQTLRALLDRHHQLTKIVVEEKNRLQQAPAAIKAGIAAHLTWLDEEVTRIDNALLTTVAEDDWWRRQVERIASVPGIGLFTATAVLVALPELFTAGRRPLAALVGVAPHPVESGAYRGRRMIGGGRAQIRHQLFHVTRMVIRYDPMMRAHYARLRARGKPYKVAVVACLRKLVGLLAVMVRHQLTWSETEVVKAHRSAPTP